LRKNVKSFNVRGKNFGPLDKQKFAEYLRENYQIYVNEPKQ